MQAGMQKMALMVSQQLANQASRRGMSSPTPTTLGKIEIQSTKEFNTFHEISSDTMGVDSPEDAFLSQQEMERLQGANFENESHLVQFFEPFFRQLMKDATRDIGYPVVLLNSERHGWVQCPHGGEVSKPDGVALGPELAQFTISQVDKSYQNDGDTHFGRPASWVLRDSIEFVTEWKTGSRFARGLGKAVEYHRRIMHSFRDDRQVQESKRTTDVLVGNDAGFYLARCENGSARDIYMGKWDGPFTKVALQRFCNGKLWSRPRNRVWRDMLMAACLKFNVKLCYDDGDCFLGYGSSGRVFRVVDTSGRKMAIKIALDRSEDLRSEISAVARFQTCLDIAKVTAEVVNSWDGYGDLGSAILYFPVGESLRNTKGDIVAALKALRRLHVGVGCAHGDCRRPNAIMVDKECLWIDLRTLVDLKELSDDERCRYFWFDVHSFFESYGVTLGEDFTKLTSHYLLKESKEPLKALLQQVKEIWS
jgi:hypothetical protein